MSALIINGLLRVLTDEPHSLQKLIHLNEKTGIDLRQTIEDQSQWTESDATPPPINELSRIFRTAGVQLTLSASHKALAEANILPADITHIVAVTCTDQGNPGFDLLICQALGLDASVERSLLSGVGCAGGLSALRVASNLAAAATQRDQAARVLVVSCELCSLFLRAELHAATMDEVVHVAPVLFSDAAAAVVVCNKLGVKDEGDVLYDIQRCGSMVVPNTEAHMSYDIQKHGTFFTLW